MHYLLTAALIAAPAPGDRESQIRAQLDSLDRVIYETEEKMRHQTEHIRRLDQVSKSAKAGDRGGIAAELARGVLERKKTLDRRTALMLRRDALRRELDDSPHEIPPPREVKRSS